MTTLTRVFIVFRMATWALAEAKAKLSLVVENAIRHEPQEITKHGKTVAVMISIEDWKEHQSREAPKQSLAEFFAHSPLVGSGMDLRRRQETVRRIRL